MSLFYNCDVATLERCRDIGELSGEGVATLRKSILLSSRFIFFTCFPHFVFAISVQACE